MVYGQEVVIPMEYIVQILRIVAITDMTNVDGVKERFLQIVHLEEEYFVTGFHQNVKKQRKKAWHDRHIKSKHFEVEGLVL